jgi:hypothetical protein
MSAPCYTCALLTQLPLLPAPCPSLPLQAQLARHLGLSGWPFGPQDRHAHCLYVSEAAGQLSGWSKLYNHSHLMQNKPPNILSLEAAHSAASNGHQPAAVPAASCPMPSVSRCLVSHHWQGCFRRPLCAPSVLPPDAACRHANRPHPSTSAPAAGHPPPSCALRRTCARLLSGGMPWRLGGCWTLMDG